jgi:D-threo-aldose 1-dehydrogenase
MNQPLPTAPVGNTALRVTQLGLGTAPIAHLYGTVAEVQAIETVQRSFESGVRYFDTAPLYGRGVAEERVGMALQGVPRDQFVLQTKVGGLVRDDGSFEYDYSRDGVLRSFDESLKRLRMDRVDILLVHESNVLMEEAGLRQAIDEAFPALIELREQGVIGAVGAGTNQWEMEWEFAKQSDPNIFLLAGRYTLLEQTSLDFLDYCQQHQISVVLGGVYNSGILVTGPTAEAKFNYRAAPEPILEKTRQLKAITDHHGVPLHVAAYHFARSHPAITGLIIGSVNPSEAEDNRAIWDVEIPAQLWADIRAVGLVEADAPMP